MQKLCLAFDDGHAGLKIRRLHIGGQAPLEAGAQTLFQTFDLLGRAVGGNDDLLVGIVQGVEGVEELLLRGLLPAMNWISSTSSRSATRYFMRKSSVLPARMAAISSLVNCSQVTYMMTKSGWVRLISVWMAVSRWVLPRPEPP